MVFELPKRVGSVGGVTPFQIWIRGNNSSRFKSQTDCRQKTHLDAYTTYTSTRVGFTLECRPEASSPTQPNRWSGGQPLNMAYASDTRRHGFFGPSGAQDHLPDHLHLQTASEVVGGSVILCNREKLCSKSRRVFLWIFSFAEAHYD